MWGDIRGDAARPPGKRRVAALRARASGQGQGEGSVVRVRVGLQALRHALQPTIVLPSRRA